jgi:hypothetical protein
MLLLAITLCLAGCGGKKTTVDFEQLTVAKPYGYSGFATLRLDFDYETLENLIWDGTLEQEMIISNFDSSVKYTFDDQKTLKNGDMVAVKVDYNENIAETLALKCTGTEFTITIAGLEEPTSFSLKGATNVETTGYNGFGSLSISPNLEFFGSDQTKNGLMRGVAYAYYNSENLKNGDTVEVEVSFDEAVFENQGLIAADSKFTVTIEGLEEPKVVKLSDIVSVEIGALASTYYGISVYPTDSFPTSIKIHDLTFTCDEYSADVWDFNDYSRGYLCMFLLGNRRSNLPDPGTIVTIGVTSADVLGKAGFVLENSSEKFTLK